MKQANLTEAVMSGKLLLVGTFLHMKKEVVKYSDRQTKQAAEFNKVEYAVLGSNGVVFVQPDTRKMPGFNMEKFVCPFKSNDRVVVEVERIMVDKGISTIAGTIEKLEA